MNNNNNNNNKFTFDVLDAGQDIDCVTTRELIVRTIRDGKVADYLLDERRALGYVIQGPTTSGPTYVATYVATGDVATGEFTDALACECVEAIVGGECAPHVVGDYGCAADHCRVRVDGRTADSHNLVGEWFFVHFTDSSLYTGTAIETSNFDYFAEEFAKIDPTRKWHAEIRGHYCYRAIAVHGMFAGELCERIAALADYPIACEAMQSAAEEKSWSAYLHDYLRDGDFAELVGEDRDVIRVVVEQIDDDTTIDVALDLRAHAREESGCAWHCQMPLCAWHLAEIRAAWAKLARGVENGKKG
jgi:hypothetical protein